MPMSMTAALAALNAAFKVEFRVGTYYASSFQGYLTNLVSYGEANTQQIRGWALRFDLSRREFADLFNAYLTAYYANAAQRSRISYLLEICGTCTHLEHGLFFNAVRVNGETIRVCSNCTTERFFRCSQCGEFRHKDNRSPLRNNHMCGECWEQQKDHWVICAGCVREYNCSGRDASHYGAFWVVPLTDGAWDEVSRETAGARFYCRACKPPEMSKCKPQRPEFDFPALCLGGDMVIHSDEIKEVTTGGGEVTAQGFAQIRRLVSAKTGGNLGLGGIDLSEIDRDDFDRRWQNAEGNMPKRIAKVLLTQRHMKLTEDLMAEIGNLAKQYTSKPGTHRISLTRNINGPRGEFVNDNSCWWSDYWYSRCTLKGMGGFGVRLWVTHAVNKINPNTGGVIAVTEDRPVGRAWMIPVALTNNPADKARYGAWKPDAMLPAPAYVIFNAYDGRSSHDRAELFDFARIIAQMTGKSYRKVGFRAPHMYINGSHLGTDDRPKGVLIAEQSICSSYDTVEILRNPNPCSCPGHPGGR